MTIREKEVFPLIGLAFGAATVSLKWWQFCSVSIWNPCGLVRLKRYEVLAYTKHLICDSCLIVRLISIDRWLRALILFYSHKLRCYFLVKCLNPRICACFSLLSSVWTLVVGILIPVPLWKVNITDRGFMM